MKKMKPDQLRKENKIKYQQRKEIKRTEGLISFTLFSFLLDSKRSGQILKDFSFMLVFEKNTNPPHTLFFFFRDK